VNYNREQIIIENHDAKEIAFLSRLINMIEDVIDDAECRTVYINRGIVEGHEDKVIIEPIECSYDPSESIEIFSKRWNIDNALIGKGDYDYKILYSLIPRKYMSSLHYLLRTYLAKSLSLGHEYYLAVLFDGKAVLLEGERYRIVIPYINHCLSAHTHPTSHSIPSVNDLRTILAVLINRGLLHSIEAVNSTLLIYRKAPLTINELMILRKIERTEDPLEAFRLLKSSDRIAVEYK